MSRGKARSPHASRTDSKERLNDLICRTARVCPWMQPDIKAHTDVSKECITCRRRAGHEDPRKENIGFAPCPHVGHDNSYAKEEQCRAEVARDDKHQH